MPRRSAHAQQNAFLGQSPSSAQKRVGDIEHLLQRDGQAHLSTTLGFGVCGITPWTV